MLRVRLAILLFVTAFSSLKAQRFICNNLYFSPSVIIGYTFGAKISYGVELDFGYCNKDRFGSMYRTGFSLSQYWVIVKNHTAAITTANIMFQKDFVDIKGGIGRLHSEWGYQNRNKSTCYGFSYDASLRLPDNMNNSWIGIRHFVYEPGTWPFFEIPYTTVFLKYKYNLAAKEFSPRDISN